ncbi:hypothetical protein SCA6_017427 [Theobroma cacao]
MSGFRIKLFSCTNPKRKQTKRKTINNTVRIRTKLFSAHDKALFSSHDAFVTTMLLNFKTSSIGLLG